MKKSLGLIEVQGLLSAISVADTMLKVANVGLNGIEKAKGFGWMTVSVTGDVAAVNASVLAGEQTARQMGVFVSKKVISKPADDVWKIFGPKKTCADESDHTNSNKQIEETKTQIEKKPETRPLENQIENVQKEEITVLNESKAFNKEIEQEQIGENGENLKEKENFHIETPEGKTVTCNLCHDPLCPRKKGEPRKKCIHYGERKNENEERIGGFNDE